MGDAWQDGVGRHGAGVNFRMRGTALIQGDKAGLVRAVQCPSAREEGADVSEEVSEAAERTDGRTAA